MSNEIYIKLHDNRARIAEKMQLIQDAASAVQLVPAGLARLHSADHVESAFAFIELAAVGVLGIMTVRELRDHDDVTAGINWVNIVVGIVLITENALRVHEGHKWFSPIFLTGVVSIFLGLVQGFIRARKADRGERCVRITDDRLYVRMSKFHRFDYAWPDIESIQETENAFVLTPRSGKTRTLKMRRYSNKEEVREVLRTAAEQHRVALTR